MITGNAKTFSGGCFWLEQGLKGRGQVGGSFYGGIFHGKLISMKGVRNILELFKRNEQINMEKVFQQKVRNGLKLETNGNYLAYVRFISS